MPDITNETDWQALAVEIVDELGANPDRDAVRDWLEAHGYDPGDRALRFYLYDEIRTVSADRPNTQPAEDVDAAFEQARLDSANLTLRALIDPLLPREYRWVEGGDGHPNFEATEGEYIHHLRLALEGIEEGKRLSPLQAEALNLLIEDPHGVPNIGEVQTWLSENGWWGDSDPNMQTIDLVSDALRKSQRFRDVAVDRSLALAEAATGMNRPLTWEDFARDVVPLYYPDPVERADVLNRINMVSTSLSPPEDKTGFKGAGTIGPESTRLLELYQRTVASEALERAMLLADGPEGRAEVLNQAQRQIVDELLSDPRIEVQSYISALLSQDPSITMTVEQLKEAGALNRLDNVNFGNLFVPGTLTLRNSAGSGLYDMTIGLELAADPIRLEQVWNRLEAQFPGFKDRIGLTSPFNNGDVVAFMEWVRGRSAAVTGSLEAGTTPQSSFGLEASEFGIARDIITEVFRYEVDEEGVVNDRQAQIIAQEQFTNGGQEYVRRYIIPAANRSGVRWQEAVGVIWDLSQQGKTLADLARRGGDGAVQDYIEGVVARFAVYKDKYGDSVSAALASKFGPGFADEVRRTGLPGDANYLAPMQQYLSSIYGLALEWGLPDKGRISNMVQQFTQGALDNIYQNMDLWKDNIETMWETYFLQPISPSELAAMMKVPEAVQLLNARRLGLNVESNDFDTSDWNGYPPSIELELKRLFESSPQYQRLYGNKPTGMSDAEYLGNITGVAQGLLGHRPTSNRVVAQGLATGKPLSVYGAVLANRDEREQSPSFNARMARLSDVVKNKG